MRRAAILLAALAALSACASDSIGPPSPAGDPTQLSVATQPSATAQSGTSLAVQPVVRLRDADGKLVSKAGIVVTATAGAGVTVTNGTATTDASGAAHFSGLKLTGTTGTYTLHFTSGTLTATDAAATTLAAGAPSKLGLTTQPAITATAGIALTQQPSVQLRDVSNNAAALSGVAVNATVVSGTITISNATAITNTSGVAQFVGLTLSGTTGSYKLRFSSTGLGQVDATASTTLAAGTATQLAMKTQPSTTVANGAPLATQPVVQLRDAFGNDVAQSGVQVAATLTGSLAGIQFVNDSVVTDANGTATFTAFAFSGTAGTYTMRFTATGYASVVAGNTTALTAGTPAKIALSTLPSQTATNGVALTIVPVIQVQDSNGNAVSQSGITITASVPGFGGTITNPTAITDNAGKATFTGIKLTGLVGGYQFQFNGSFNSVTFQTVTSPVQTFLQAGAPTQLAMAVQPSTTVQNASALVQQPQVRLLDQSGNFSNQSGVTVTATLISGTPVVSGGSIATNGNGVAVFTALTLTGSTGTYKFRFSAASMTSVDAASNTTVSAGAATQLILTTEPSATATSGVALAQQPVVQLRDVSNNVVPQSGVSVTATVIAGTVTIGNATFLTNASGNAVYSGLTLTASPGSYQLRFDANGVTSATAAQPTQVN